MNFKLSAFADEADKSIDLQIKALNENSISYLEIRGVDGENISSISIEKAKEVKQKLDENNIKVWSIGSPIGKCDIEGDFTAELEKFSHTLEIARVLEAKRIRMFSFFMPKDKDPEQFKDEVVKRLKIYVEKAKEYSVILCHENEKGIYGDIASRCKEIHEAVPELSAVFDPANFMQCHEDTLKAWDLIGKYVDYFHVKDCKQDGTVVPAGSGDTRLKDLLSKYSQKGGEVLTIEPHLTVFSGLEELEQEGDTQNKMEYTYKTGREAFDVAVDALKTLVK